MGFAGHVARTRAKESTYKILVGEANGKKLLRRNRCRWEDNNDLELRETEYCIIYFSCMTKNKKQIGYCEQGMSL
jgi:hypothetical protein